MVLYGASGHAKVVIDICQINNHKVNAIIDDNVNISSILGRKVIQLKNLKPSNDKIIVSIGNNRISKNVVKKLDNSFGIAIHPNAIIDDSVDLKEGSVVMAGTVINSSTKIGRHCIINTSCSIDHDNKFSDFSSAGPGVITGGNVEVGYQSYIGLGSLVRHNVKILDNTIVGFGSLVNKDCKKNLIYWGSPAKKIRKRKNNENYL